MKKLAFMLLMLGAVLANNASAQTKGINFEKGTYKATLEKAAKEDKLIFVDIYTTWCGPCKRMASEVFTQEKVGKYFNATFVNAKFDAESGEGVDLAKKYAVRGYPTFLLLNSKGEEVGRMMGGSPADDFIKQIKDLKAKAEKK